MDNKILLFFAGLGFLIIVFVACGNTSNSNPNSSIESTLDIFQVGHTYEIGNGMFGGKATVLEKPNGSWIKVQLDRGRSYNIANGYLNIETLTFVKAE